MARSWVVVAALAVCWAGLARALTPADLFADGKLEGPAAAWSLFYEVTMPGTAGGWTSTSDVYDTLDFTNVCPYTRAAYLMILDDEWAWASFDPFDPANLFIELAFPNVIAQPGFGASLSDRLQNVNIRSSKTSLTANGVTGRAENYPNCFKKGSDNTFNSLDPIDTDQANWCYGSFQFHNMDRPDGQQTVMAFNGWAHQTSSRKTDIGIGTNPPNSVISFDWRNERNANSYTSRKLYAFFQCPASSTTARATPDSTTTPRPTTTTTTPRPTTTTTMGMMMRTCPRGTYLPHAYACDQPSVCRLRCTFARNDPRYNLQFWEINEYHCGSMPVALQGPPLVGHCWDSNGDPVSVIQHQRCVAPSPCD